MERLLYEGKIPYLSALEITHSRLGIGFEKLDRAVFDPNKAYDKVARIGVKKIRIQSGWMRTEKEKGVYDFAWLDEIVDELLARGLEPWMCLCYGNPLYTDLAKPVFGAVGCPPIGSEAETRAWLSYVETTVRHFRGRVTLFEIWNEPDCNYSWRHEEKEEIDKTRNAREYGVFALKTAKRIKEANPEAEVAAFALGHLKDLDYVNTALATGLFAHIDYVSFHVYSPMDTAREEHIGALKRLIALYNPEIRIFQGESGAQSRSDGNGAMKGFAWTRERQMKQLLRTMVIDLYSDLAFTSYFSTMDMIEALRGRIAEKASYLDYGYFGVLSAEFDEDGKSTGEYTEKPSYYALSTLASLLRGDAVKTEIAYKREILPSRRVNGSDCADDTVRIYPFRLHDGKKAIIYWNATQILTTSYEGTISFTVFGETYEHLRLIDLRDGSIYALPGTMKEELPHGGVRLRNLPLLDVPLGLLFE